eukprot:TRINITY_DN7513_c0_g1_i1.p1 TRINITY_DN7513_c0_g1~~TRINITY_DN7513_c0_g1_i1.p1  ORF type:complete len:601 (-),score=46.99 TRINITY_DN7513_c0_g1_i1:385-2187(-)
MQRGTLAGRSASHKLCASLVAICSKTEREASQIATSSRTAFRIVGETVHDGPREREGSHNVLQPFAAHVFSLPSQLAGPFISNVETSLEPGSSSCMTRSPPPLSFVQPHSTFSSTSGATFLRDDVSCAEVWGRQGISEGCSQALDESRKGAASRASTSYIWDKHAVNLPFSLPATRSSSVQSRQGRLFARSDPFCRLNAIEKAVSFSSSCSPFSLQQTPAASPVSLYLQQQISTPSSVSSGLNRAHALFSARAFSRVQGKDWQAVQTRGRNSGLLSLRSASSVSLGKGSGGESSHVPREVSLFFSPGSATSAIGVTIDPPPLRAPRGLRKMQPRTPGLRGRIAPDRSQLSKRKPEKNLLLAMKNQAGKTSTGRLVVRCRGGGHRRHMRIIDFKRRKVNVPAVVQAIEYDPSRTAYIALLMYADGEKAYILAPNGLKAGDEVLSGEGIAPKLGHALPLKELPTGILVHNVELQPGRGGAMARVAGSSAQLLAKGEKYATLKLPSGERRLVLMECMATVGSLSNSDHMNVKLGKAGRNRWLGNRPRTRGVAMNPVDHPMGGGEGRTSGGGHPRSRSGLLAKGKVTRNRKKKSSELILKKRKK